MIEHDECQGSVYFQKWYGMNALRQAYERWKAGAAPIQWAKDHQEFASAFESFPFDADKLFSGWREKLGVHK